jgi:hypothetical protein
MLQGNEHDGLNKFNCPINLPITSASLNAKAKKQPIRQSPQSIQFLPVYHLNYSSFANHFIQVKYGYFLYALY